VDFEDRADAGRRLAARLGHLRGERVVVVGLPRGGVPVAFEVARALGAPLGVIVVRKLGMPFQPELGMGAIGEDGVRVIDQEIVRRGEISADELAAVDARERRELERRAVRYRRGRPRQPLEGRVVVVDDGLATDRCRAAVVARPQHAGPGRRHARNTVTVCDAVPVGPGVSRSAHDLTPPPAPWYGAVQPGLVRTRRLVDAGRLPPCNAGHAPADGFYPWPAHSGAGWPGQARRQPSVQRSGTAPAPAPPGTPAGNSVPSLPASTSPRCQRPGRGA